MDEFYDSKKAVEVLEAFISNKGDDAETSAYNLKPETFLPKGYCVEPQSNKSYALARGETTKDLSEAIISIQGVLCSLVLPPFPKGMSVNEQCLRNLHQGVTLTGLGSPLFQQSMGNLLFIQSMFRRFMPDNQLEEKAEFFGEYEGHSTISASNRFFTRQQHAAGLETIPISEDVDPNGVLSKADLKQFVHTEENEVTYHLLNTSETGDTVFSEAKPIIFHVRDIVEICVSVICFPIQNRFKVKLVLRSLALINGQITTNAFMARSASQIHVKEFPSKKLKRRKAYASQNVRRVSRGGEEKNHEDSEEQGASEAMRE
ncbi:hypothetical protein ONZ45_g15445 [Pleurotus djamor]|nr:hypothetical protein ONZ45_g15445 [Pleurotus djamor]